MYTYIHVCGYILYNKHAEEVHTGSWDWREAISRMSWGLDFSIISWFWLFGRLVSFLKSQGCIIPGFTGEKHGHCPNSHDLIFVSRMVKLRRLVSQTQYLVNTVYIYIYLYIYIFFWTCIFHLNLSWYFRTFLACFHLHIPWHWTSTTEVPWLQVSMVTLPWPRTRVEIWNNFLGVNIWCR